MSGCDSEQIQTRKVIFSEENMIDCLSFGFHDPNHAAALACALLPLCLGWRRAAWAGRISRSSRSPSAASGAVRASASRSRGSSSRRAPRPSLTGPCCSTAPRGAASAGRTGCCRG